MSTYIMYKQCTLQNVHHITSMYINHKLHKWMTSTYTESGMQSPQLPSNAGWLLLLLQRCKSGQEPQLLCEQYQEHPTERYSLSNVQAE